MAGKRPHARWFNDACRERAKRRRHGSTGRIGRPPKTRRYEVDPATGCWNWLLGRLYDGYALVHHNGRTRRAHIVMWEAVYGPVPPGKELHHRCENKSCVNPDHLRPLTRAEHALEHARTRQQAALVS